MEYPKWLYHATEKPRVVNTPEERKALGPEWAETPADALKAQAKKRKG